MYNLKGFRNLASIMVNVMALMQFSLWPDNIRQQNTFSIASFESKIAATTTLH